MHELAAQITSHLRSIWRHRWYAAAFAWLIAIAGWAVVYKMPDRYEANARFYIDTQSVLRPLLSGLAVQPNLDQIVGMMSRTLVSRPNMDKLIRMAGLDHGSMSDEERAQLISRLSAEVSIKSAGRENLYVITSLDRDPEVAKRVVESLLTLFVEHSAVDNRRDSDSALKFIDEQLDSYREKLVSSESAISDFKRRNQGMMPGDGPGYFARVMETKTALNQATLELREAENESRSIQNRLSGLPQASAASPVAGPEPTKVEAEIDLRIRALEQKLDNLRTTYTEQHPDIVSTLRILDQLRQQREMEIKQREAELVEKGLPPTAASVPDPVRQQLTIALTAAEAKGAALRARVNEYSQRYAELQTLVKAAPQVEADFTRLTRDYDVYKARYDDLLKRRNSAQISGELEASNVATAFRVVDPPRVARVTPDPRLMISLVLGAALAGGIAVAFLISQIKPTINDEYRLKELTGLKVLGTVAMSMTDAQKTRRNRGLAALVMSYVGLISAYATIMSFLVFGAARV
jgi:polysaccharide chain length determinant protein (PEP-CTERM system associated)